MSVYAKALLPLLLVALCACRVDVGHHDGEAASQAAAAAPVLQSVEVGKTTVEQIRALYPDAVKMEDGVIIFGNRRLGSESGAVEVYQSNVQNGFPLRMFAFDGESKLLQMMILARTDNEVATLVKDLESAGFAPYPHLRNLPCSTAAFLLRPKSGKSFWPKTVYRSLSAAACWLLR